MNDLALRQYPIGKFSPKESYTPEERQRFIHSIETLPGELDQLVKNFTTAQWATPYREGGWTARQVVHHVADSHMNAYIRVKWALTEDAPLIKAYDEKAWATTPEVASDPSLSINLLYALHAKWVTLLRGISEVQLTRSFIHPATGKPNTIERMMALYSWHGEHHLGHLKLVAAE